MLFCVLFVFGGLRVLWEIYVGVSLLLGSLEMCSSVLITVSLFGRYGEALFMNSKLISGVTEFLNTEAELNEVRLNFYIILRLVHLESN